MTNIYEYTKKKMVPFQFDYISNNHEKLVLMYRIPIDTEYLNPHCFTTVPNCHGDQKKTNKNQMLFQIIMMYT